MVVCRFFQQGTCRYGQNCRFEHSSPQYAGSTVSPLLRQNVQTTSSVPPPRNTQSNNPFRGNVKKDANDIFNLMVQDINEAEKGGVWPLSCYNFWPAISSGNVPGLEDISPDEMRHMQLQAQAGGNIEACFQQIQQLYQQARARFNSLKVRSAETLSIIETLTQGPPSTSSQFSFASGSSVVQDSWPASPASQSSIFGGASSTISNEAQKSIFGGSSGFAPSQGSVFGSNQGSLFGSANSQPSVFGGASPQKSVFGGSAQQPTNTSPFGTVTQQTSIFGNSATVQQSLPFGSPSGQQASPFVNTPASQQASPFGAPASVGQSGGSIFGGTSASTAAQPSSFSFALPNALEASSNATQIASSSPFGAPALTGNSSGSIFGGSTVSNMAQPTGSTFGGFGPQSQSAVRATPGSNVVLNSTIYTSITQLTEDERREFEAETFTVGKIPSKPPPRELC
ncbi:nucleoporin NUP42-like [Thrips palmi]|uniref:Nucleoporin NUP42 n=1 Tax=Thrips palmi TaxID=161013 RepID=A0A6P8ZC47_THRPL|nr:nucleoporin NUP42-like [Thrips palmi]